MSITNLPSGYIFRPDGLYRNEELISNFFVVPVIAYRKQGEPLPFACDIEIHRNGSVIRQDRILLEDMTKKWWASPPPGCWYDTEAKKADKDVELIFHDALGQLSAVEVIVATSVGWLALPDGRNVYVTGNGIIGEAVQDIWIADELKRFQIETDQRSSDADAVRYFWELFNLMPGYTDVLLVYMFSALLSPLFREAGMIPRFPLFLEGDTEAKKTTLACLTCGIYSRQTNPRSCVVGMTSSRSAIERRAKIMRNCILIVDDLFPDGGTPQSAKMLNLVRDLANQDAREIRSGNDVIRNNLDCGVVITGEYFPMCNRSTRTRCFRIKLPDMIPNSTLYPYQENASLLGNVVMMFLSHAVSHYTHLVEKISVDFQEYRVGRSDVDAQEVESERLFESGFFLSEALDIVLNAFPRDNEEYIMEQFQENVKEWIDWQLSPEAAPDLRDIAACIPDIMKKHPKSFSEHHGCWCIPPDKLCRLVQMRYGDKTITQSAIIKILRQRNALQMDKSGAATKKVDGVRYLFLNPRRLR